MKTAHLETSISPELAARTAAHTAASARMGPSSQPARSADQGEAAALLDLRQLLLVHAGGVDLQPQRYPRHPATLRPGPASSPGGGD